MYKLLARLLGALCLIFIALGLTGCEQILSPRQSTPTPAPEATATITPTPTATPVMPAGPYPPVLLDYEPRAGQEVATAASLILRFDQPMDRDSVVAALSVTPAAAGDFVWLDDATLVFRPAGLAPATRYRVKLLGDARSAAGVPLSTEFAFAFSTLSPLQVTRMAPSPDAPDTRIDAPVIVAFNRAVVPLTCVGEPASPDGECRVLPLTFTPTVLGAGMWEDTALYRFDPFRGWAAGRAYTVSLAANVASVEGVALAAPVAWSFTPARPVIQARIPEDKQRDVPLETDIRVVFNTPMDQEITGGVFRVTDAAGVPVPGSIRWQDNGALLTFSPAERLRLGMQYAVQIEPLARAATSAPLENPQTWTFTTALSPTLVTAAPQDGATGVGVAEPVRLTFAGALDAATLNAHITVTPTAEHVYTRFDAETNVLQLSWDKQPQTSYCVLLEPGIADVYGNAIAESHKLCFVTGDLPVVLSPAGAGDAVTLDAAEPARLYFLARNLASADFALSEVTEPDFVSGQTVGGVSIREWKEKFTTPRNSATLVPLNLRRLGGVLPLGYYRLTWENPPWGTQSLGIAVVDRHVTLKLAAQEALVWVTDLRSGEPISRTAVRLVDGEGLLIAAGTTDGDGLAAIPISPRDDLWEKVAAVVGEPGQTGFGVAMTSWLAEAAPAAFGIALDGGAASPFIVHLYTDRLVYGPEHTVSFRGIVRKNGDRYSLPAVDTPVLVTLRAPSGQAIYSTTLQLSDMGTFDGALTPPDSWAWGAYTLEAVVPAAAHARPGMATCTVMAYRAPEFEISLAPESAAVAAGSPVRVAGSVDKFSGGPAAHVPLTWRVTAQDAALFTDVPGGWQWNGPSAQTKPLVVAQGEALTDAGGRFLIELPAAAPSLAAGEPRGPQRWSIEVTAPTASDSPLRAQADWFVHPSRFYLGLRPREWVVRAGARTEVSILALDWDAQPVAEREIAVTLVRRDWYPLPADPAQWVYTATTVSTLRAITNRAGQTMVTLTPPRSGNYVVAADTTDADGNPVHTEIVLWVSGAEAARWRTEAGKVTPVANARVYQVGATAKILLPVTFAGPYQMLMTVERDGIYEVVRRVFDTPNPVVEIPIVEAYAPNVYVSFVLISGPAALTTLPDVRVGYITLAVEPAAQRLTVEVLPDKTTYTPGDTVTLTVRVADAAGRSVDAEFSLSLFDKATLSSDAAASPALFDAFYGARPLRVMTGDALLMSSERMSMSLATSAQAAGRQLAGYAAGYDLADARDGVLSTPLPDTVFWETRARTGATGETRLTFVLPAAPTTWVAEARAITADTKVGAARVEISAAKPLHIRPVTPGFLVVGDQAEIAAVIHNDTDQTLEVTARLAADADALVEPAAQTLSLAAGGRARVTWQLSTAVRSAETLALAFSVEGVGYRDAVVVDMPLYRYALPDAVGTAGVLDAAGARLETVIVPPEAGDASALIVYVASSPAGALVDTLAYLEQYPYDSTDVLIDSFVAYVFTYRALHVMSVSDETLLAPLRAAIVNVLERLYARQNVDGGWGQREAQSTLHLTAYATLGLLKAQQAGFDVRQAARGRALAYIQDNLVAALQGETRQPQHALGLYVLSEARAAWPTGAGATLYAAREALGVVGRAYLALALGTTDPSDSRLPALLDGLRGEVRVSAAGAHWASANGLNGNTDVAVTGVVVAVLARFAPDDPLLPAAKRWLMLTRRGERWQTTYETGWAIVGLAEALRVSGDVAADYGWKVTLNGALLTESTAQPGAVTVPWRLRVGVLGEDGLPALFRDRANVLQFTRDAGSGLLYYTALMELTVPVEQIAAESRGMSLRREYCAVESGSTGPLTHCVPLTEVRAGQWVAVRLTFIAPQTRAYVRLEDPYPAGLEPIADPLGRATASEWVLDNAVGWGAHPFEQAIARADRAVFIASDMAAGTYQVAYLLRAVTPGTYRALPAVISAARFPEIWGRAAGAVLTVLPAPQP